MTKITDIDEAEPVTGDETLLGVQDGKACQVPVLGLLAAPQAADIITVGERTLTQVIAWLEYPRMAITGLNIDSSSRIPLIRDDAGNVLLWIEGGGLAFGSLGPTGQSAITDYLEPLGAIPYQLDTETTLIPLIRDDAGNVVVWLENGGLACSYLSASMAEQIEAEAHGVVSNYLNPFDCDTDLIPIARDASGKVPLWFENGGLACSYLSDVMVEQIRAEVQGRQYGYGRKVPVATDGRTLYQYRAKLGFLEAGANVKPTILLVGDSQLELPAFPQALANKAYNLHGKSADGWLSAHNPSSINGISRQTVGVWTNYDASNGVASPIGFGPDGKATTATGTNQREIFYNVRCTEFTVHYRDGVGALEFVRYDRAGNDPGNPAVIESVTPLVFGGTNTAKSFTFTGQPDELRNYEIRTVGNTGTVAIHGYRATRNAAPGIIVEIGRAHV